MKKRSMILTLIFALSLYGCGKQETAVNEVSTDAVAESDSSDVMDEQANEQTPSDEQTQDDNKEVENADSDYKNQTETANENKDTNAENDAAGNEKADNEAADNETADNEVTEEAVLEYTVTTYDESKVMYASGPVNVRKGPSTDFERVGALTFGQEITVTGQADTNWYEIMYGEEKAYVSNKYLQNDKPTDESQAAAAANPQTESDVQSQAAAAANPQAESDAQSQTQQATPEIQPVTEVKNVSGVILVGDSRFVQMQENVGANSCTWIAEGGKGYTWFEEKAIP
ncbi:MAG: SH3 domain-containing protein, partial [Lachnospiraceae bacterium]|nr:SH3 domain-containing protein [Lachnospiraceae bacterium]